MFWGVAGAQNVLDIRCLLENRQFDLFWQQYRKPLLIAALESLRLVTFLSGTPDRLGAPF